MTKSVKSDSEKVDRVYSSGVVSAKQIHTDLRKTVPPLVDVKVTNPIIYIKSWWSKIIGNEGIDLRIRVKPITAIAISIIVLTVTLGIGRFVFPFKVPFFVYTAEITPTPGSSLFLYRDTAFTGILRRSLLSKRYYLTTSSSEAINLEVPSNLELEKFIGRRIFATGKYQEDTRTLLITEATDIELLPENVVNIPTVVTTMTPIPTQSSTINDSQETVSGSQ